MIRIIVTIGLLLQRGAKPAEVARRLQVEPHVGVAVGTSA